MIALVSGSDLVEIIIMGDFQLQARLKCCCKHSRNLHGATYTIQQYALLSMQAIYAQLLLLGMRSLDHCIYLKCRSDPSLIQITIQVNVNWVSIVQH